eukprot:TRINITY_DN1731_c0_g1_i2.p3 TRINITY_DN1731_c0_g1~~TRINITY_DN1731_c0_g1_i2.p3  ORF type:complete len:117 (-),score=28.62 TRINITY_DN1731_c0_g1_i2:677-1027(-)
MEGSLAVEERVTSVRALQIKNAAFSGNVGVKVGGKLPGALSLTPQPVLRSAGLSINAQVLQFASGVFVHTICADYRTWVKDHEQQLAAKALAATAQQPRGSPEVAADRELELNLAG